MFFYTDLPLKLVKYNGTISKTLIVFLLCLLNIFPVSTLAKAYSMPLDGSRLIGSVELYKVKKGDYFQSIARAYNVGLSALMHANPDVDPFLPATGTMLQIPNRMLLPSIAYQGIVVNLPELRLYYFEKDGNKVHVFPVGIGRVDQPTPIMQTKIMSKIKNPSWTPSKRIKEEYLKKYGKELSPIIPAGKDNPLGDYALQLAFADNEYLIHGTNQNFGIGMRVSSGCIRMNPEDIEWLFNHMSSGDSVAIIDQPIKATTEPNGENLLEVHSPLSIDTSKKHNNLLWVGDRVKFNNRNKVDNQEVKKTLLLHHGLPVNVDL